MWSFFLDGKIAHANYAHRVKPIIKNIEMLEVDQSGYQSGFIDTMKVSALQMTRPEIKNLSS